MTNDYNEFVEDRDLDQDIATRKELIQKAKELQASEDKGVYAEVSKLMKEWRKIPNYDSALDAQLNEEFEAVVDSIYAKRKNEYSLNEEMKKSLIAKAKGLVNPDNWNKATAEIEELMNEWRSTGSAGKDNDDSLWNEFNEARQAFFDNKHKYWEEIQAKFNNARAVKNDLIAKAKESIDVEDFAKGNEIYQSLLEQWKAIGSAGKEFEEELWEEFNEARQKFYDRRNEFYAELHERQGNNATTKRDLVDQAKKIADAHEYTKENTEAMKKLSATWKTIGSSGKEEDGIWKDFRAAMDSYFDGLREYNNKRQAEWRAKMQDARARKQDMIMTQKRQIQRLQGEIATMYSQREIDDTMDLIEEKKEFIEELEAQIADIEKKLAEQK